MRESLASHSNTNMKFTNPPNNFSLLHQANQRQEQKLKRIKNQFQPQSPAQTPLKTPRNLPRNSKNMDLATPEDLSCTYSQ